MVQEIMEETAILEEALDEECMEAWMEGMEGMVSLSNNMEKADKDRGLIFKNSPHLTLNLLMHLVGILILGRMVVEVFW